MPASPLEVLTKRAQTCIAATPVIILGSGASIAAGIPGMEKLRKHIIALPTPSGFTTDELKPWNDFKEKLEHTDLESALQEINLPEALDDLVVEATWQYLQPFDIKAFDQILTSTSQHPLTELFQTLLRSTNSEIHVVTPNYDRIAEYAAEKGRLYHETGFSYGHLRHRLSELRQTVRIGDTVQDRVNIWKVHGSFDWFRDEQGIIQALPITYPKPTNWKPAIVTPGLRKYQRTHDEPFVSIKAASDRAFSKATAFFCSGFGFNDNHIQTKLKERCRSMRVPLVLISWEITPSAKAFFEDDFCKEYLAIEHASGGCKIFCPEYPDGEIVTGEEYWQLESFLKLIKP